MTTIFSGAVTTAGTVNGTPYRFTRRNGVRGLSMQVTLVGATGGTSFDAKVQTSLDGGTTWIDIWHATQFLPGPGRRAASVMMAASAADFDATAALASASTKDGILGDQIRGTYTSVGTYSGTTFAIDVIGEVLQVTP